MKAPKPPRDIKFSPKDDALEIRRLRPIDIKYLESLGYEKDKSFGSSGWLKLKHDVPEHKDYSNYGRCLVQCSAGSGVLQVWDDDRGTYYKRYLSPGKKLIFNDHNRHSFELTQKPCILMVVDLKK